MDDFNEIAVPRKPKHIDKKKRHARGFNESHDPLATRKARVGFKQYLRELAEQAIDDDMDYGDDTDLEEVE